MKFCVYLAVHIKKVLTIRKNNHAFYLFIYLSIFQMVLAAASHLYFDHRSEDDQEELGMIWASSGTDDLKVFEFNLETMFSSQLKNVTIGKHIHQLKLLLRKVWFNFQDKWERIYIKHSFFSFASKKTLKFIIGLKMF